MRFRISLIPLYYKEARAVARLAEKKKKEGYHGLSHTHFFIPVAIETSGAMGSEAFDFFKELGKRICSLTHEVKSIIQQFSKAVQRGNLQLFWALCNWFFFVCFFCFDFIYFVTFVLFYLFIY